MTSLEVRTEAFSTNRGPQKIIIIVKKIITTKVRLLHQKTKLVPRYCLRAQNSFFSLQVC